MFFDISRLLGGIAVFLYALKLISSNVEKVVEGRLFDFIRLSTRRKTPSLFLGMAVSGIAQSSVAINMVLITLVDSGVVPFLSACAVVIGTNIGTTVTAQIVSLSFSSFSPLMVAYILAFIAVILSSKKHPKLNLVLSIFLGFSLVFIGIDIITQAAYAISGYKWFRVVFCVENDLLLVLNGFVLTAICQSSSVVTSLLVIISASGLMSFENCIFVILGANVGACVAVIIASLDKGKTAKQVAIFNVLFNVLCGIVFFALMRVFKGAIVSFFVKNSSLPRAVANFHTVFNVVGGFICLPIIKYLCKFCDFLTNFSFVSLKNFIPVNKKAKNNQNAKNIKKTAKNLRSQS